MNAIRELLNKIEQKNIPESDYIEQLQECEDILKDVLNAKKEYDYSDLEKDVPKSHRLHDMRRIHEVCQSFDYESEIRKVKYSYMLFMPPKTFRWVRRNLQVINVGWIYVLYSAKTKMWKLGRTELTMKPRMSNYARHYKVKYKIFCKHKLRQTERSLLKWATKEKKYKIAMKKEYFYLKTSDVPDVIEHIKFLTA